MYNTIIGGCYGLHYYTLKYSEIIYTLLSKDIIYINVHTK